MNSARVSKKTDIGVGIGTIVVSILLLAELLANEARRMGMSAISSRTFPLIATGFLLVLGSVLLIRSLASSVQDKGRRSDSSGNRKVRSGTSKVVMAALLVAALLLRPLGFYPVVAVLLLFLTAYLGQWKRPGRALLVSAATLIVFFLVFTVWLGLLLPRGVWL